MSVPSETAAPPTVLIVEDSGETRELYAIAFESHGYRALRAESAEVAMEVLRRQRVDAVVADYDLPGATGNAFFHQAFNEGLIDPKTPALICTGYMLVHPPMAIPVLYKPVDTAVLVAEVDRARAAAAETVGAPIVDHRVSGYEFVRVMLLAGYRLVGTTTDHAVMERGEHALLVPQSDELTEELLVSLLRKAQVLPQTFVALVNRLASRDTWPEGGEVLPARDAS